MVTIERLLDLKEIRDLLPQDQRYVKFLWDYKSNPTRDGKDEIISLYAIKSNRTDTAPIEGDVITDASQVFDQLNNPQVTCP